MKYIGWQVGLAYQTVDPHGLDYRYMRELLHEMREEGMNFLSLLMMPDGCHDPLHDGYCWPVSNSRLQYYVDRKCTNANLTKEFVGDIISETAQMGFHVQLFLYSFWWNPIKIRQGYPNIAQHLDVPKVKFNPHNYCHCIDNKVAWQATRDEVQDLLEFYHDSPIHSFCCEMPYQGRCYCQDSQHRLSNQIGEKESYFHDMWFTLKWCARLKEYVEHVKKLRPGIEFWLHYSIGHYRVPHLLQQTGVDRYMPIMHSVVDERCFRVQTQFVSLTKWQLHEQITRQSTMPYIAGVNGVLQVLKRKYKLGLISNNIIENI